MKNQVVWVDIPVIDLDRAIEFYAKMLGEKIEKVNSHGSVAGILPHADGGVGGVLYSSPDHVPSNNGPMVYLNAEGRLAKAVEAVKTNKGKVLQEIHPIGPHGFRAVVIDSEGNRIALHSLTN